MTDVEAEKQGYVSILIPCKAEYVALCRLVAGALGMREGLDEEEIADLKLVVTEICNCFLGDEGGCALLETAQDTAEPPPSLQLEFRAGPDTWQITASNPDRRRRIVPASVCDPTTEGGLGLTIIRALVDSVEFTDEDAEGSVLRLVKRRSPEPSSLD